MKYKNYKLITIVLSIVILYSCSTSTDVYLDNSTTVAPVAPSNLTGVVASTTQINLSWTDNSTNEIGFKIERKTGTGTYAVVGNTATDITTFNNTGLTPATTYTYRVYSNNTVGNSLTYSNELIITTSNVITLPALVTTAVSSISTTTAISGGNISSDGGAVITARGVCWSTNPNPTIALITKTTDGTGIGPFTSNLTGLIANITYYIRAYATTSLGTGYGNEYTFTTSPQLFIQGPTITDIDGNNYPSITNCSQTWMQKNLNVSHYKNGDIIPQALNGTQWANLTTGAWCYYNYDSTNGPIYGKLYNWYAVAGIYDAASAANPALRKKIAPIGWHVPTDAEWTILTDCLGGESVAGGKMKARGTIQEATGFWESPNTDATNSSGFNGLPGGLRKKIDSNTFLFVPYSGNWWSSTEFSITSVWYRKLDFNTGFSIADKHVKTSGCSVRCIKD
jgi:uncharacterized protein (TIGR02145 family)